jgi:hypothetical protein
VYGIVFFSLSRNKIISIGLLTVKIIKFVC